MRGGGSQGLRAFQPLPCFPTPKSRTHSHTRPASLAHPPSTSPSTPPPYHEPQGVTAIKYVTDGTLLAEMAGDPLLGGYAAIVVDEAHERSLATDTLLGLLKKARGRCAARAPRCAALPGDFERPGRWAQEGGEGLWGVGRSARLYTWGGERGGRRASGGADPPSLPPSLPHSSVAPIPTQVLRRRPDLRLIISSATLEVEKLRSFFTLAGGSSAAAAAAPGAAAPSVARVPAVVSVEGRTHPVAIHYALAPADDYVRAAVAAAVGIHREDVPGDILIFLTGQEECEAAVALLREEAARLAGGAYAAGRLAPAALYAGLPAAAQRAVFAPAPRGVRKVVAATNVAETSLTIEGVVYVIDACFVKQRAHNPVLGLESLLVAPASKASAAQRAGRAGRVRPGHAFRLCTQADFEAHAPDTSVPEMQRSDLTGARARGGALANASRPTRPRPRQQAQPTSPTPS